MFGYTTTALSSHIQKFFMYLSVFPVLLYAAGSANLAQAKQQKTDCMKQYKSLSGKHSAAISRTKPGTISYFKTLHGIEDDIFGAMQNCPQDTYLLSLMGEVQISLGNTQLAELYAKKAIGQNPDIWQTNHLMGKALSMQNKYDVGISYLEKAVNINNTKPALFYNLCSTSLAAKKFKLAVKHCSSLIGRNDHQLHASAYHIRSQAYKALGMQEKSKHDLNNARLLGHH